MQKNGRPGQKQHGVDIYGPDYLGRLVGVQCKRYEGPLKLDVVLAEISNAEGFKGQLSTLYIATTADHDSKLQEQVRIRSEERAKEGKFAIGVLFWDEIVAGLMLNPAILKAHYPQLVITPSGVADKERQLAALEFGYFGGDIWEYVKLVYGEFGWMAQTDPDELIATLRVLEHHAQRLLSPKDAEPIIESLIAIQQGCQAPKTTDSDWDMVELHAKRASSRIQRAASLLPLPESNVLSVALQICRIYHHVDDLPTEELRTRVKVGVEQIVNSQNMDVETVFAASENLTSGYQWATRIFNLLNREIRYS